MESMQPMGMTDADSVFHYFQTPCLEMDTDGLPLVGPGVDYEKVCSIEQKRTVAFLNHFIVHTARFLNRFSTVCEDKLANISQRIQRLDAVMKNLESKINSVPGLEDVTATEASVTPASQTSQTAPEVATAQAPLPQPIELSPEPEPEANQAPVSKDPRYEKYFKMLAMGVPAVAVQNKMRMEGVDPSLLDRPNDPSPAPVTNDADDFSDEANSSDDSFDD